MAALEMVHDIRAEFDRILMEIDWMDKITKARYSSKKDAFSLVSLSIYTRAYDNDVSLFTCIIYSTLPDVNPNMWLAGHELSCTQRLECFLGGLAFCASFLDHFTRVCNMCTPSAQIPFSRQGTH